MYFPTVRGQCLDGRELTIPFSLDGEFNILMVLFEPSHQFAVQSWLKPLKSLRLANERVRFFEVPTLAWLSSDDQRAQDSAIRDSVVLEDQLSLETVITLYVQKQAFCTMLDIPHEDDLYVFLIDSAGVVLWRTDGHASPEKVAMLTQLIDRASGDDLPGWAAS